MHSYNLSGLILGFLACGDASRPATADTPESTAGSITTLPSMAEPRAGHTATKLLDGRVLIVGGLSTGATGSAELFEPAARRFVTTGRLASPRASHTATLLPDGRVLIAGGYNGTWLA